VMAEEIHLHHAVAVCLGSVGQAGVECQRHQTRLAALFVDQIQHLLGHRVIVAHSESCVIGLVFAGTLCLHAPAIRAGTKAVGRNDSTNTAAASDIGGFVAGLFDHFAIGVANLNQIAVG